MFKLTSIKNNFKIRNILQIVSFKSYFQMEIATDSLDQKKFTGSHIIWVDLEMTGLNIEKDAIIEIACLITDQNLNIVAEGKKVEINLT